MLVNQEKPDERIFAVRGTAGQIEKAKQLILEKTTFAPSFPMFYAQPSAFSNSMPMAYSGQQQQGYGVSTIYGGEGSGSDEMPSGINGRWSLS